TIVETAVEFDAEFTSNGGTIARSEWKIYYSDDKTLPEPLKTIEITGPGNKVIVPLSLFVKNTAYYWTVQCWDSYDEASNIDGNFFYVKTPERLPSTTIEHGQSDVVVLPDSTKGETALVTLASEQGSLRITPLKVSDFPGASSVFANLFDIRVENITPNLISIIIFEIPGTYSAWLKYRYDNNNQKWQIEPIPANADQEGNFAKLSPGTLPGYTKVELHLKDGGKYDEDGKPNGVISDLSGCGSGGAITDVKGGGGGCFIATAAFGSYQEHHVWILRQFRDRYLLTNPIGKAFVNWYYKHSPKYASIIADNEALRAIVRVLLLPVYAAAFLTLKLGIFFWLITAGILVSLIRRWKIVKKGVLILIAFSILASATPSLAYDFNLFKPATGEQNFIINQSSQTLKAESYQFDAFYSFTDEVTRAKISGTTRALVKAQHLGIIGVAYGINDYLTIGANLPFVISQDSKVSSSIVDVKDNGIGNLTVFGKYKFFGGKDQMGLAIVPFVELGTGDRKNFISADSTVLGVKLVVDRNWCNHTFLTFNIGASHQNDEQIGQIKISNAILFGIGFTQLLPNEKTYAAIEVNGRSDNGFFEGNKSVPIEALGSITHIVRKNLKWTLGIGTVVNDGYSTPNFRVFTGLRTSL
ncbi:MAG: CFI-box-CTERM domain-containing protein, partial [Candidatus Ratteibacteria bacterium]